MTSTSARGKRPGPGNNTASAPAAAPDRARRHRRPRRRDIILGVAAELFAQRGYAATGIDDIGAAAGISGPGVYRHFASKDDLFKELVQRGVERLLRDEVVPADADETPAQAVHRLVTALVEAVLQSPSLAAVIWNEQAHLPPETRSWMARLHRLRVAEWVHILSRLDSRRGDAEWVTIVNGVYGMAIESAHRAAGLDRDHVFELLVAMIERSLLLDRPARARRPAGANAN